MRKIPKYKNYIKLSTFPKIQFPERILKFKRPKWKKLQTVLKKNIFSYFSNNIVVKKEYKRWEKIKSSYKDGLLLKNKFDTFFDNNISLQYFNRNLSKNRVKFLNKNYILHCFIKPLFRIDFFLAKLKICNSSFESQQLINKRHILINGQTINSCVYLNRGDIISFKSENLDFKHSSFLLNSFCEIDYYNQNIFILKNFFQLDTEDFLFILSENFNFKTFIDYIKK
jgi:ribosomal protein S4